MTPHDVLDRVTKAYAGCRSYRDRGVVRTAFIHDIGEATIEERPFETAFVRPNRFRFEHTKKQLDRDSRYLVWREGDRVRTWWDVKPGIKEQESLGLALAGATGVSGGSAHAIPALLLPDDVGGRPLTDITAAIRGEDADFDGVNCFRIAGMYADWATTVWVDKESFLVRRIDKKSDLAGVRTEVTTTYYPTMDEDVSPKALRFEPPSAE